MPPLSNTTPDRTGLYLGADVADTLEAMFADQGPHRPALFWLLILLLGGALAALPAIRVDVFVSARGVVAPTAQSVNDFVGQPGGAPSTGLTIEAFLPERNLKYLRPGQSAALQYDAYPYTEWGTASGTVIALSSEPVMLNQRALYRVLIHSDVDQLHLGDGRIGRLAEGMAATVRFVVNRKSLFQLVYQKSEDLFGL